MRPCGEAEIKNRPQIMISELGFYYPIRLLLYRRNRAQEPAQ